MWRLLLHNYLLLCHCQSHFLLVLLDKVSLIWSGYSISFGAPKYKRCSIPWVATKHKVSFTFQVTVILTQGRGTYIYMIMSCPMSRIDYFIYCLWWVYKFLPSRWLNYSHFLCAVNSATNQRWNGENIAVACSHGSQYYQVKLLSVEKFLHWLQLHDFYHVLVPNRTFVLHNSF